MIKMVLMMMVLGVTAMSYAVDAVRYDAGMEGRPVVATGVEMCGALDGSEFMAWDTTAKDDGWMTLISGGASVDVLVLNTPAVVGGRIVTNETWSADRIRVVRDDVVVPSGLTLTLEAGCIVKFLPGARFDVENGGALVANGALLADFADDFVGGDVNLDGDGTSTDGTVWWLEDAATAELATVAMRDGAAKAVPSRSYTAGVRYGNLPSLTKDGFLFGGWWTDSVDGVRVTDNTAVSSGVVTLHARWIPLTVAVAPAETNVLSGTVDCEVSVTANGDWTVATDAEWILLRTLSGSNDGTFEFSVEANTSKDERVGTVRVSLVSGGLCDLTVCQAGMGIVATPKITPVDGTTFSGSARRVTLACAESGAEIRYTLDGSEPTGISTLYAGKSFNVFDTTLIRARAFKAGMLPSEIVSARIIRLQTLAEALDAPLWTVTTEDSNPWTVNLDVSRSGGSSARSGRIGSEETSTMTTIVEGAGTLSFWWRASCEDDPDYDSWDYLAVYVDGLDVKHIDGDSGWQHVSLKIKGGGTHKIEWVYSKDDIDGDDIGEDCGWVDGVTWSAEYGDFGIPVTWLENLGAAADSGASTGSLDELANADPDGDGLTTADEYIAGTDPNDASSSFTASIEIVDGNPVVTYTPDLVGERTYIKWGKKTLSADEPWVEVGEGDESNYNFFKVTVEMK